MTINIIRDDKGYAAARAFARGLADGLLSHHYEFPPKHILHRQEIATELASMVKAILTYEWQAMIKDEMEHLPPSETEE